jgi:hypothetical protein
VGAHQADTRQRHVPAVGVGQAERAGGEPHDMPCRLPLNLGNRTFGPQRFPVFDACQFPNPVARFARPDEYASFEFSAHHGAISSLAWFHVLRGLARRSPHLAGVSASELILSSTVYSCE